MYRKTYAEIDHNTLTNNVKELSKNIQSTNTILV